MKEEREAKGKGRLAVEFLQHFVIGGFFVMIAIWVAKVSTPAIGGIIAALPIRYGLTWTITALREGKDFAEDMAKGSVIGMPGNILFSITLYFLLIVSIDFFTAFILSVVTGTAMVILLKLTFPE